MSETYDFKKKIAEATGADKIETVVDNLSRQEKVVLAKRLLEENKKRATKLLSLRQAALAAGISLWSAKLYKRQGKLVKYRVKKEDTGTSWDKYTPSVVAFLRKERDNGVKRRGNYKRGKRVLTGDMEKLIDKQQQDALEVSKHIALTHSVNEGDDDES